MSTEYPASRHQREPWNKGRLVGQKRPLNPKDVWTIRVRLQMEKRRRDLAMFNLAIDSKLRGCDLVRLKIDDVCASGRVRDRTTVVQKKTGRPVQIEITEQTRAAVGDCLRGGRLPSARRPSTRRPALAIVTCAAAPAGSPLSPMS